MADRQVKEVVTMLTGFQNGPSKRMVKLGHGAVLFHLADMAVIEFR